MNDSMKECWKCKHVVDKLDCGQCINHDKWESRDDISSVNDSVNHPSHYTQGKYEVIDIIEDATKDLKGIQAVCDANVLKYALRWPYKNGIEDLKKAQWYLDRLIKEVENASRTNL